MWREINTSCKTVIVMLDGIDPYITFMIIQNTARMYRSNIKTILFDEYDTKYC
jgi:hypothetical protein